MSLSEISHEFHGEVDFLDHGDDRTYDVGASVEFTVNWWRSVQ